jgi:hypothetical protein
LGVWVAATAKEWRGPRECGAQKIACRFGADFLFFYVSFWPEVFANLLILLVEPDGIEPTTSSMPLKRSPN